MPKIPEPPPDAKERGLAYEPDPECTVCSCGYVTVPFVYRFGVDSVNTTKTGPCGCWDWRPVRRTVYR
jgi:hypothetical protein